MGLFRYIFKSIAELPLIGPDGEYEADLLIHGSKPIGLFVDKTPPQGVLEDVSPIMDKIRADIFRLDNEVLSGNLSKCSYTSIDNDGMHCRWNYYCQPGLENDMNLLAEQIRADNEGHEPAIPLSKDHGHYFGYKPADIRVFQNGGYESAPPIIRSFLEASHCFRLKCRVSDKLNMSIFDLES